MTWTLVAVDGSEQSARAISLVASIPWPADMRFSIVSVVPTLQALSGAPYAPVAPSNMDEVEADEVRRSEDAAWAGADALRVAGLKATCRVVRGRPGKVIADLANRLDAELIVVGRRGLGTFESALLGSVSDEIVDRAHCPVLVVRSDRIDRTVIADDGSPEAEAARRWVDDRPYLLGQTTELVGVAPMPGFYPDSFTPLDPQSAEIVVGARYAGRQDLVERLSADATETRAAGVDATTAIRDGGVAREILAAAAEFHASLIVIGTHGRHGLARIAFGSVSRAVVHRADCSVLVVRGEPVRHTAVAVAVASGAKPAVTEPGVWPPVAVP
jgi:nucleotide-binding universal stress UspA family protein